MGLTYTVGLPADVFMEPFATLVAERLAQEFGKRLARTSSRPAYCSDELGWSGWRRLQERAAEVLGEEQLPHFLSMAAWQGCYVPLETAPTLFDFADHKTPLAVASLPHLIRELQAFGVASAIPTHRAGLEELAAKYDDDDQEDDYVAMQTYANVLLAALEARRRRQVLWIVK